MSPVEHGKQFVFLDKIKQQNFISMRVSKALLFEYLPAVRPSISLF